MLMRPAPPLDHSVRHGLWRRSLGPALGFALLLTAVLVRTATSAAGALHLGYGDCAGAGPATAALNNACSSNLGSIPIVASFSPPVGMNQLVAIEGGISVYTSGSTLSPWWHMEPNGCRADQISISFDFTNGPYTCNDIWGGQAIGAMFYTVNALGLGPNSANILFVAAVSEDHPVQVGTSSEYYGFTLRISRSQSAEPGSCAGCTERACFVFDYLKLDQPAGVGDFTLTQGDQSAIAYNGGGGIQACASARVQKGSWGAIKAIYH